MLYIIGSIFTFIYIFLVFLLGQDTYFFGLDYMIKFVSLILLYFLDQPVSFPSYDFNLNELKNLKRGMHINIFLFISFFILALSSRLYEENQEPKKIRSKRFFGWFLFLFSILTLFTSLNNYSESLRQEKILSTYKEIIVTDNGYSIDLNNELKIKKDSGIFEDKKNQKLTIEKENYKIEINVINIKKLEDYKNILKSRYSYNLKIINNKKTKYKKKEAIAIEYLINKDYNRDYIIRGNKDFIVISLKTKADKSKKILNEFKKILVSSIYLSGE